MSPRSWDELDAILDEALDLPPEKRPVFFDGRRRALGGRRRPGAPEAYDATASTSRSGMPAKSRPFRVSSTAS